MPGQFRFVSLFSPSAESLGVDLGSYIPPESPDFLFPICKAPLAVGKTRDKFWEELMTKHGLKW